MVVAAAWASLGIASAQQIERTFERTINLSGAANLDLTTDSGGIIVTAGSGGSVRIRGILKSQRRLFAGADVESRIRQIESNPPIEQSGNTIRVGYVQDRHLLRDISMRLEIVVPPESQVRARADSGGIRVEGVRGPVDCKTDSGGIEARHIESEVRAVADSGGIHVRDVKGPVYCANAIPAESTPWRSPAASTPRPIPAASAFRRPLRRRSAPAPIRAELL